MFWDVLRARRPAGAGKSDAGRRSRRRGVSVELRRAETRSEPFAAWPDPVIKETMSVDEAKAIVAERTKPQTEWKGPTDGPTAPAGSFTIAYVSPDQSYTPHVLWGQGVEAGGQGARMESHDVQRPGHRQRHAHGHAAGSCRQPDRHHHAGRRECAAKADQGGGLTSYSGDRHPCHRFPRTEPRARPLS